MYNKKCHIVAFLHSEKVKKIFFLIFFKKNKKISFWEKK
jgi:hypothetical protein